MRYHYVYRTLNLVTGHFYYGVHSTRKLDDGYLGSGKRLQRAVKKYGKQAFRCEPLQFFKTPAEAYAYEKMVIKPWLGHPLCYNLHPGGKGGWKLVHKPEIHAKSRQTIRERPESLKRISENARNTWTGRKHRAETITKMKTAKAGHGSGTKNSSHGTCWIYNERAELVTRVDLQDLDVWLANGEWQRGRKMKFNHVKASLLGEP